jgi:hypothetical protein
MAAPDDNDEDDVSREVKPGITRTGHADGSPPTYEDHRDFLTKMHGALGAILGHPSAPAGDEQGNVSTIDHEVNKAVATTPGNNADY